MHYQYALTSQSQSLTIQHPILQTQCSRAVVVQCRRGEIDSTVRIRLYLPVPPSQAHRTYWLGCPNGSAGSAVKSVQHSAVQGVRCKVVSRAVQCSAASAVQCSAVQCSAVQCSPGHCSAVQCSKCSALYCSPVMPAGHFRGSPAIKCISLS
jgi:hypothetical protein